MIKKKIRKSLASLTLAVAMLVPAIPVLASSYDLHFSFDSNLLGTTRYFDTGKTFAIYTNADCDVNTYFNIYLYKRATANSVSADCVGSTWNYANKPDTGHITSSAGAGYYYTVFKKPKSTYGKWCSGDGTIKDGQ